MKSELNPSDVLFHVDLNQGEDKFILKDIPKINSAYKKIKKAISINEDNYNLYLVDSFSKYRLNEVIKYIEDIYADRKSPDDICYVTYDNNKKPEAIFLNNGNGIKLKENIDELKNKYFDAVYDFYNTASDKEKDDIIEDVNTKRSAYITELVDLAKNDGFDLKVTKGGFTFIPIKDDKEISEREYDKLPKKEKDTILLKAGELKKRAEVILDKVKEIEIISIKKLKKIYKEYLETRMEEEIQGLLLEFIIDNEAYDYIEKVCSSIERQLVECYSISLEDDHDEVNTILNNYEINVLVDNSKNEHPRVIYEEDPSISNLIGNIEYENHNGGYVTNLSLITPGSLLLANNGCIIIRLNQLISNNLSYYSLKKALLSKKLNIDISKGYLDLFSISGIKPEAIPLNVKVILIGDYESYDILYNADEDFRILFPLRAEFNLESSISNGKSLKAFVVERFSKYNIKNVSEDAVIEVLRYLSRLCNDKNKIKMKIEELDKIIIYLKEEIGIDKEITKEDVINVMYDKESIKNEIYDLYKNNKIIMDFKGEKVGAVNGLAVIDSGYYSFGKVLKIDCICAKGTGRIIDIQKESNMSGSIHEKSINILNGILKKVVSSYSRIPVDFYVSFEQVYGMLDGDSASIAEIVSIISALSNIPVKQNMAVTGSLNLFGDVQAIGGATEKIEGLYEIAKVLDNNDDISVLIPRSNVNEVVLLPEIEEAIVNKKLHIYAIDTIYDAIELLMNETIENVFNKIAVEIEKYKNS